LLTLLEPRLKWEAFGIGGPLPAAEELDAPSSSVADAASAAAVPIVRLASKAIVASLVGRFGGDATDAASRPDDRKMIHG
jgi:hypothetical protein